ncbi:hypothetical protein ACH5RR_032849 [Cinchona calisaya]|uniref:Uncharacterized protein n=1 Tax=Cinchona calisaya TaxID=153742 RepID=A0ABD2YNN7_9GENT
MSSLASRFQVQSGIRAQVLSMAGHRGRGANNNVAQQVGDEEEEINPFHSNDSDSSIDRVFSHRGQRNYHQDYGVKVDILDFEGQLNLEDFIDWLAIIEEIISLVEKVKEEPVFDSIDENETEQEKVIYGDEGEALVVQCILKTAHVELDKWTRHNIFHTRCISYDKMCIVILDSGSCENVVPTIIVEKLQLKNGRQA